MAKALKDGWRVLLRWRGIVVALVHVAVICAAHLGAYLVRFDGGPVPASHAAALPLAVLVPIPVYLLAFVVFGVQRGLWRYINIRDVLGVTKAIVTAGVVTYAAYRLLGISVPRSIPLLGAMLVGAGTVGLRMAVRLVRERHLFTPQGRPVLIYGAGDAAHSLMSELGRMDSSPWYPVGVVDDKRELTGSSIGGVPILGTGDDLGRVARKTRATEVVIAIPSARQRELRDVLMRCRKAGLPVSSLPNLHALLVDKAKLTDLRPVNMEQLLGREPVPVDEGVRERFSGRRVLVTGAGGSIGSELCRQLLASGPEQLVMLDRYENCLAGINGELERHAFGGRIAPVVADVTDAGRIRHVFESFRPQFVFHAAAHKHVPMMEWNPGEAVKNNILGTRTVAHAAHHAGVEHFTLISTDKAVNPTSVMGATKRVAEFIVRGMDTVSPDTSYCVVRFGNVLGSNGSVVPIFQRQIKAGGPVTVTHPEMRRFFMTISEAVQLVIQSACVSEGGERFVLDMGTQVHIMDLARRLIRLHGYEPDRDIEIQVTGLRPGEKLFEELFDRSETVELTPYPKLMRARGGDMWSMEQLDLWIDEFSMLSDREAVAQAPDFLTRLVPSCRLSGPDGEMGAHPELAEAPT